MGKRRKTAKTGDKNIHKVAGSYHRKDDDNDHNKKAKDDDDPMFDEVDRYHNLRQKEEEEFLRLDSHGEDGDSSHDGEEEEAVMDLGVGGGGSSEEDDSSSSSGDGNDQDDDDDDASASSSSSSSSSASSAEEEEGKDVLQWGKKKSMYYNGDTADLEIGQDAEDAFLEEEAVKDVQAARYKDMQDDDFMLSDAEEEEKKKEHDDEEPDKETTLLFRADIPKLLASKTRKEKRQFLKKQHPELVPLVSYFSDIVQELDEKTSLATQALCDGKSQEEEDQTAQAVGATTLGKQYLVTKALIQSTSALNLAMYLLLKSEQQESNYDDTTATTTPASSLIQSHPVMTRLQHWNELTQKLEDRVEEKVDGLQEQLENLVKASQLLQAEEKGENQDDSSSSDSDSSMKKESMDDDNDDKNNNNDNKRRRSAMKPLPSEDEEDDSNDESSNDDHDDDEENAEAAAARRIAMDARFGLRSNEIDNSTRTNSSKRRKQEQKNKKRQNHYYNDFGDYNEEEEEDNNNNYDQSRRSLASTINAIEQRSNKKRKNHKEQEDLDDDEIKDDELRHGLQMMEAELGRDSEEDDENDNENDNDDYYNKDDDDDEDDFYSKIKKKSQAKKAYKKSLYQVAPKFPRQEQEIEGERAITRTILKNRGLVAHKNKLNRNPRVKKREQYRKALIRRKGAVREVRTDEGHQYGGEETGIKSNLSRSRKL